MCLVHISSTSLDPISQRITMNFNYIGESPNSTEGNNLYLF